MAAINKVTYTIKNLSDAPISFVGLHTLTIPGASEAEYTLSEAAWKKLLPRIRAKKTLVVTKAGAEEATAAAAATTATTTTAKTTKSTTSTKTSTKSTTTKDAASATSTATTSTAAATETSTDATTSTKEG